jgi:hypothetical protein
MSTLFDLDTSLINFSSDVVSNWTIREAVEGVGIFGGIGGGKTSASGRLLAKKYLQYGFGGLVLTAKPDEKDLWVQYCKETNRVDDLIIVEPGGKHRFNFIEYESTHRNGHNPITGNIVQVLKTVIRSSEEKSKGRPDDRFWESALDLLIYNTIDLCLLADEKISIQQLYDVAMSIPKSEKEERKEEDREKSPYHKAFAKAQEKIHTLVDRFESRLLEEDRKNLDYNDFEFLYRDFFEAVPEARTLRGVDQFFVENYTGLADRTRSIIDFSFSGFLFHLLQDPIYSLFCNKTSTFTPEDSLHGKIIVLNLPVKIYHNAGRDCQVMFKYIWQRAMEKRDVKENARPVFLFADEAQHFLHEYDSEYQATARSSRIATVYISQNLANFHANMGGESGAHRVTAFLGTLGTKIFHSNADRQTNEYASALIGDGYTEDITFTKNFLGGLSAGESKSYKLERIVRPEEFVGMKNGGPKHNFQVEGYMHRQGSRFADGMSFQKITFSQTY